MKIFQNVDWEGTVYTPLELKPDPHLTVTLAISPAQLNRYYTKKKSVQKLDDSMLFSLLTGETFSDRMLRFMYGFGLGKKAPAVLHDDRVRNIPAWNETQRRHTKNDSLREMSDVIPSAICHYSMGKPDYTHTEWDRYGNKV